MRFLFPFLLVASLYAEPPIQPIGSLCQEPTLMAKISATIVGGYKQIIRTALPSNHWGPWIEQVGPSCGGFGTVNTVNEKPNPAKKDFDYAIKFWEKARTPKDSPYAGCYTDDILKIAIKEKLIEKEYKELWTEPQMREALLTRKSNQSVMIAIPVFQGFLQADANKIVTASGQLLGNHWLELFDYAPNNQNGFYIFGNSWGNSVKYPSNPKLNRADMMKLIRYGAKAFLVTRIK